MPRLLIISATKFEIFRRNRITNFLELRTPVTPDEIDEKGKHRDKLQGTSKLYFNESSRLQRLTFGSEICNCLN